jgi:hypothetical protein
MTTTRALSAAPPFSSAVATGRAHGGNFWGLHLSLLLALMFTLTARAQDKKSDIQLRTFHGAVLDRSENPVPSSVVYLKNVRSQAVKTYIADDTGHYRFSGLDPNVDYELHAEHGDLISSTRTISSFDSRRDVDVPLKLTKKKPAR